MSGDEDGELEFIGEFEKPPPNILAEITLLDDEDEESEGQKEKQVRVEVDSDSDISIIEFNPSPPENDSGGVSGRKSEPNSYVKRMSSHQKESLNRSNYTNSQQLTINKSGDHDYDPPPIVDDISSIVIDGEQNDNNELVVGSKSKEKGKKKKGKKSSNLSSEKESNDNEDAGNEVIDEEANGKKKSKKKKNREKRQTKTLEIEPLSLRDPVFVGKVLYLIPVPSIAFDSTLNFNNQNASALDDNGISTKGRRNTKDANINVNDNLGRINSTYPSTTCQRSVSSLEFPMSESENISGARNPPRVESHQVFQPEAQSMNHFIKRLGISQDDHKISNKLSITTKVDESTRNDVGKVKSRKRKRSTTTTTDTDSKVIDEIEEGEIEIEVVTLTDADVNPNKSQTFNSRIDKNPVVKEHIDLEELSSKLFPIDNEKIRASRKDCSEKNDSLLMRPPPPPPKNVPVQNLTASSSGTSTSSLMEANPHPWDPVVIRKISDNNKLGLPNSWTPEMIDFYAKQFDEDFELDWVFSSMTDEPRFWAAPCENNRYRNRTKYMHCRICNERNQHETRYCPNRGKLPVCTNCGLRGHTLNGEKGTSSCNRAMCLNCGLKSFSGLYETKCNRCKNTRYGHPVICALCGMKGHVEQVCPDQWRRYHSTTTPLAKELLDQMSSSNDLKGNVRELRTNKTDYKPESKLHCCNCSRRNHNYFHCQKRPDSEYTPNKPFVIVELPTSASDISKMGLVENEMCQDQDKNPQKECESTSNQDKDKNEQDVIILEDSDKMPDKIRKLDSSGSGPAVSNSDINNSNESRPRPCPSLSVSYEISRTPSTSTLYASGYSKKHLEIINSTTDLSKSKSVVKNPEPNSRLSHLTNNSSTSKQHTSQLQSRPRPDQDNSSKRRRGSSSRNNSPIKRVRYDYDRDSSRSRPRKSNDRYFDSYKYR